jgi:NADH-quinone oxidoreductase subunit N
VMGAFMVVQYASRADVGAALRYLPAGGERTSLDDYRGFARRHPLAGALLALFLFSLAGIPPALSGFWAKYLVFQAGVDAGLTWLVVVGVLASAAAAFFYLRVVVVTYLQEPEGEEPTPRVPSPALRVALGAATVLTVVIGFAPQLLVDAAAAAGRILG